MPCEHNPDAECFTCADNRHRNEHPSPVAGCLTCKLQSIQVSPRVTGQRRSAPPAGNRNSWESGVVRDHRGVPLMKANGAEIGVKDYAQNRRKYEEARRVLATHPDPFGVNTERR